MRNFTLITLGCPKNIVDSRNLIDSLIKEGFIYVEDFKKADFILINTCCFIEDAKEESIEEILTAAKFKSDRILIVFGCLSKRYGQELKREIPEIDVLFGIDEESKILEYMQRFKNGVWENTKNHEYTEEPPSYRYIKIAEGCSRKCTFCVIPDIRGKFRSIKPEIILKKVEGFIKSGIKEIILVAQDITQYGKDLKGYTLKELLKDLCQISGDFWLRLLYLYPTDVDEKLLQVIKDNDKIVKYLDIPLQHSEDRILRLMGRRGSRKEYLRKIREIKEAIPEVALRSSFIVGFPTETEDEFHGLLDFIEEVQFNHVGTFKYSRQEDTIAYHLKGQIPEKIKERRYFDIMSRQALISLEKNRNLVGRKFDALIDYVEPDIALGRLYCHAPEIDGVVMIENALNLKAGDKVKVLITEAYDYDVKGVLV